MQTRPAHENTFLPFVSATSAATLCPALALVHSAKGGRCGKTDKLGSQCRSGSLSNSRRKMLKMGRRGCRMVRLETSARQRSGRRPGRLLAETKDQERGLAGGGAGGGATDRVAVPGPEPESTSVGGITSECRFTVDDHRMACRRRRSRRGAGLRPLLRLVQ